MYNSVGSLVVFCIAGFINGVGYAPTYAMTMSYLDDNSPPGEHASSPYIGEKAKLFLYKRNIYKVTEKALLTM